MRRSGALTTVLLLAVALILFGIVMIFVRIPHCELIYSVIGLVVFAGLTMVGFQRLRRSSDLVSAPLLAASTEPLTPIRPAASVKF